jgi:hypothetical protein
MSSIFQKVISGDIDTLGTWSKDPVTQKILCRSELFGSVPAGKWLKLEYILAIVKGFENADIGTSGEISFENGSNSKRIAVQFTSSVENGKAIARAGQAIQLLVPANAKIIVTVPLFFTGSGPGGGAEVALTGVYVNA